MPAYAAMAEQAGKIVGALSAGYLQEAQINAQNKINEANAFASNLVRGANNKLRGARAELQRYVVGENNKRVMESTGNAQTAATVNYRRTRDAAIQGDIESQIAFAEQSGAQAAASAFSGLTGGVADMVNATTALRKARLQQRTADSLKQGDYDAQQQQVAIARAGWDSLDHSEVTAEIDYGTDVAQQQVYSGNILSESLGVISAKSAANIFSSFKGYDAFADRAGPVGSGSGYSRTITGGR